MAVEVAIPSNLFKWGVSERLGKKKMKIYVIFFEVNSRYIVNLIFSPSRNDTCWPYRLTCAYIFLAVAGLASRK